MTAKESLQGLIQSLEGIVSCPDFEFEGKRYPCTTSTLLRGTSVVVGGKSEDVQLTVTIRKNAVRVSTEDEATSPTDDTPSADEHLPPISSGKTCRIDGRLYRILTVAQDGMGVAWEINLGSVHNRGK